jgi:hypothetical protein
MCLTSGSGSFVGCETLGPTREPVVAGTWAGVLSLVTGRLLIDLRRHEKKGPRGVAVIGEDMCKARTVVTVHVVRVVVVKICRAFGFCFERGAVAGSSTTGASIVSRSHRHSSQESRCLQNNAPFQFEAFVEDYLTFKTAAASSQGYSVTHNQNNKCGLTRECSEPI